MQQSTNRTAHPAASLTDPSPPGESAPRRQPFFYGWIVVLGCALMMGAGTGVFVNSTTPFTRVVPDALGVSRGAFTLYSTIGGLTGMVAIVVFGELFRRNPRSFRKFVLLGSVVCSAVFFCYSFATSVWHFYILSLLYGCTACTMTGLSITTMVNNWFSDRRGLATGIAFTGSGIMAATMTPIVTNVIEAYGWRWGYRLLAVVGFCIMMLSLLLIRETPEQMGLAPLGAGGGTTAKPAVERVGLTRAEAIKTPALYLMCLGFALLSIICMGINLHSHAFLTEIGYSPQLAARVVSVVMLTLTVSKVVLGALFDKLGSVRAALLTGTLVMISVLCIRFVGAAPFMPWVYAVIFGCGYTALTVPYSYLTSENFGTREFAAVYSFSFMISGLGGSFANPASGFLYDHFGSYLPVWNIYFVLAVIVTVVLTASALLSLKHRYNPEAFDLKRRRAAEE